MARKCFYSFHYNNDSQRTSQVRNIGTIEGSKAISDNDWESITKGGEEAIKRWISGQLYGKSCAIVLVGSGTANRKWINHEIVEAWNKNLGVVGIRIHGLKNLAGQTDTYGHNPFDYITYGANQRLSSIVKCYDPPGADSKAKYDWIATYLEGAVEEAIKIRGEK